MDKDKLINSLLKKDNTDKWYLAAFFVVFIVLILFVIRPNVNEYLRRQKLLEDRIATNALYDQSIGNLRVLQGLFEEYRDQFALLEQAVPEKLEAYSFAQDVTKIFLPLRSEASMKFTGFDVGEKASSGVPEKNTKLIAYKHSTSVEGRYSELQRLLSKLMNQRRIKHVTRVVFTKNAVSSDSAKMGMKVDFQGYHLQK